MSSVTTLVSRTSLVPLPDGRQTCAQEAGLPDGAPVVLCHGGHSRLFRHLPGGEFEQVPGGGHLLPLSDWDRVLRAATRW